MKVDLKNLEDVLQKVTEVDSLGHHLKVPKDELAQIFQMFHKKEERKREILQWWLSKSPNPTWEEVIRALKKMKKMVVADAVAVVSQRKSLNEPCEDELHKWEELFSRNKLDETVVEYSEHLENTWEKEYHEYMMKLEKIEEDWKELVKTQKTRQACLTLGISLLFPSNSEPLHQYSLLEQDIQQQVERNEELGGFQEKATEHRRGLQNTDMELKEWEKALLERTSVLKEGVGFSREEKDRREQLERSHERLQICRDKMRECTNDLTKSQRQVLKCRKRLVECEVKFKRYRDELGNSHSECIEELKKKSEDLSAQIKTLTIAAGGILGTLWPTGAGAAIGAIGGPPGIVIGAAIGLGLGLSLISPAWMTEGQEMADCHESQLKESREMLCRCKSDLNDSRNVVERCEQALRSSEEKLKELKTIVSGLEQTFFEL